MNPLFVELQWLPPAPKDFSRRLTSLAESLEGRGREARALASCSLNLNLLTKLAKAIGKIRDRGESLAPLVPFRLAVLSNSTPDFIVPALIATAPRHGIVLEVIQAAYDQVAQEALTLDSKINRSRPDAVLLALDFRAFPLKLTPGDSVVSSATVQSVIDYLSLLCKAIKANSGAPCIIQTLAPPVELLFGSLDCAIPGTIRNLISEINERLTELARGSGDIVLDVASLAETVGLADWHNPQLWNLAKLSFSEEVIPLYADHVARTVAAMRGKSRKALVLDLDNTVWGGVVGDDGVDGIQIAQGDAKGEAYLTVQRFALDLRRRGIALAVASKNNDEVARAPFLKHPDMLLKLEHIAVFQANWSDKATNIQAIAKELSLGLDAMVFMDDNPVERGLVRQLLPEVAVPELPEDPAYFVRTVAAAGYFEAVTFVSEDLKRASYYQDNAKRAELQKTVGGVEAYLASLDMTITFQPFDATGRERIVQLINKSNQYNLTTHRYNDPDLTSFENDPGVFTLQVRLADTFGDNGMISVVICRPGEADAWEIDTWVMSCRVLGRKVEYMVLRELVERARAAGIQKLIGVFRPTDRNQLVVDHYEKLGFTKSAEDSGVTRWELVVEKARPECGPMKVVSHGFKSLSKTDL
jgi:FkbH-like protein